MGYGGMRLRGFYFITDAALSRAGNQADVAAAVCAGCRLVQYRRKEGTTAALFEEAARLKSLCPNALFLVNDRVDIALAVDADGVHVGRDDLPPAVARKLLGPGKCIGVTVRSVEEAIRAAAEGADYLGVGPIHATGTKKDAGAPKGVTLLREVRAACPLPLAAIGGLSVENAREAIAAGADMLCAIGATVKADDPEAAVRAFERLFEEDPHDGRRA